MRTSENSSHIRFRNGRQPPDRLPLSFRSYASGRSKVTVQRCENQYFSRSRYTPSTFRDTESPDTGTARARGIFTIFRAAGRRLKFVDREAEGCSCS
eukprot:1205785-Prymnesium_polylepis.1